jgi:hypothetical protein
MCVLAACCVVAFFPAAALNTEDRQVSEIESIVLWSLAAIVLNHSHVCTHSLELWRLSCMQGGMTGMFRGIGPRALSNGINSAVFFCFFEVSPSSPPATASNTA